jgi:hypothetical protein
MSAQTNATIPYFKRSTLRRPVRAPEALPP